MESYGKPIVQPDLSALLCYCRDHESPHVHARRPILTFDEAKRRALRGAEAAISRPDPGDYGGDYVIPSPEPPPDWHEVCAEERRRVRQAKRRRIASTKSYLGRRMGVV